MALSAKEIANIIYNSYPDSDFNALENYINQFAKEVSKKEARKQLEAVRDSITAKRNRPNITNSSEVGEILDQNIDLINEQIKKL